MNLYEKIKESSLLKESDIKVGDVFKNKQGATIKVVEPTKAGEPQFNFLDKDGKPTDCRGTNSYESLAKILKVNGYEKVNESDDTLKESWMDAQTKVENTIKDVLHDEDFKDPERVGEFLDGIIQFIRSFGDEYNAPVTESSKLKESDDELFVVVEAQRNAYSADKAADSSMTVGELISELNQFDDSAKVILSHDNGYTYGSISAHDITEEAADLDESEKLEESDELNLNIVMNQAVKELMPVLKEFKFDGMTFNYKLKDDASDDLVNEAFKLASDKVKAEGCTLTRNTDTIEIK